MSDSDLRPDGTELNFSPAVSFSGKYPNFRLSADLGEMGRFRGEFECTEMATWFIKSPFYDHLSLHAAYQASIETPSGESSLSGFGTIEYARCVGLHSFVRQVPRWLQIPVNSFTYHIVDMGEDQLLYCRVEFIGHEAAGMLYHRTWRGGRHRNWSVIQGTHYEVVQYEDNVCRSPYGTDTLLPKVVNFGSKELKIEVTATYDTPQRFGVGKGYIAGYSAEVSAGAESFLTRGYSEYVRVT